MDKYKTVEDFLIALSDMQRIEVRKLREIILAADSELAEHIKWNAPSYKKGSVDRITFNVMNKSQMVMLVFHMGATRKEDKHAKPLLDNADLIEWVSDTRGYMKFSDLNEILQNEEKIKQTVVDWLSLT